MTVYKVRGSVIRRYAAQDESCPEVDGVIYRPGVYKIPKVRMTGRSDENREGTGLNVGLAEMQGCEQSQSAWASKNSCYENP